MGPKEIDQIIVPEKLVPGYSSEELNFGPLDPEALDPRCVEVRFGDPMVDAPRLLQLFTHPETIEHIAGITPNTTEKEIRDIYRSSDLVLLTAESPSGLIVGTITVQKPAFGARAGGVLRLAVDPEYRNKGIGKKLVKAANAFVFRDAKDEANKGLNCSQARASVIVGVSRYEIPQNLFRGEGYLGQTELVGTTRGWNNRLKRLSNRNSQPMLLDRDRYKQSHRGEHVTHFPKQRPTN